jgi:hypothetical protein
VSNSDMASSGWGHLESGLPGEWAALILVLVGVTLLGGVIIAAVCIGHERTITHRASARAARASAHERDRKRERELRLSRTSEQERFYQLRGSGDSQSGHAA